MWLEPEIKRIRWHDRRHAVVDTSQVRARLRGDDGRSLHLLAVRPHPTFPKSCERDRAATSGPHHIGTLPTALILPFIEAVGRDEATPSFHGIVKSRLVVHRFAT